MNKAEEAYQLAFRYGVEYKNCSQAVLRAIYEVLNLKGAELVIKSAHPLAGGLGLSGNCTCGALAGGVLALGLVYGRSLENMGKKGFLKSYVKAKELYDMFVNEFGGCSCKDVQLRLFGRSFNLWNPEDFRKFEEMGGHKDKCTEVSGKVARWVVEIILADEEAKKQLKIEE
ncbi:MAG: C-GCAxxG-C-C family protein [Candidatus Nezhaarchaeota archaeon]|nr:C-GCAxxG-C-C family protein [Candidatus Nezhaarchaeota archaeon]MCX8141301.1 C-GCAxxG-C-C family protein [Candidatus Nezhaarchaeota archaeon]MDW8049567.1 C-GCAxxG-C-C family protein [Nitrososphaerota archaeon]